MGIRVVEARDVYLRSASGAVFYDVAKSKNGRRAARPTILSVSRGSSPRHTGGGSMPEIHASEIGAASNYPVTLGEDKAVITGRCKPEWQLKWLPGVLRPADLGEETTHTLAIYHSYIFWHKEYGDGRMATRRAITEAVTRHYGFRVGHRFCLTISGNKKASHDCPGWVLVR